MRVVAIRSCGDVRSGRRTVARRSLISSSLTPESTASWCYHELSNASQRHWHLSAGSTGWLHCEASHLPTSRRRSVECLSIRACAVWPGTASNRGGSASAATILSSSYSWGVRGRAARSVGVVEVEREPGTLAHVDQAPERVHPSSDFVSTLATVATTTITTSATMSGRAMWP